jgi:hypothetical protein
MDLNDSSPSVSETISPVAPATEAAVASPETPDTTPTNDASSAPASGAPESETKESLLEAVMKVVKPPDDADKLKLPGTEDPLTSEQPKPETADGQDGQEDLPDDPTPEELSRYTSRTRKRIGKLLDQRKELQMEVQTLRGEADMGRGVREYLQQNDIQKEDFAVLLDLGAALRRGDWQTFYAGVKPYVQVAEEALGVRLPQDLAQRVQQGHMTTDAARQFSQERYARQMAEANAYRTQAAVESAQQRAMVTEMQNEIAGAVSNWENQVRQTDPDYGLKQDAVKNILWAVVREQGAPQSPQHAVEIAKEAYRRANELTSRMAPKPRATAPVPSSIHRSTGATAEPKNMMEAAMLGLSRSRRSA